MIGGDSSHATAEVLLDARRLSDVVGDAVRADRLRHKPGLSTVGSLVGDHGPVGWVHVVTDGHAQKLHNARRRAAATGERVEVVRLDAGLWLAHGRLASDPRLAHALDDLRRTSFDITGASVVRYNPLRRMVLRADPAEGAWAVRLTAARRSREHHRLLRSLAAAGIPVVPPVAGGPGPATPRVTTWPWVGDHDLAGTDDGARGIAAERAGRALAMLHRHPLPDGIGHADHDHQLRRVADDIAMLDDCLGKRAARAVARTLEGLDHRRDVVLSHGDFSADQVAVGPDRVWLLDLDRVGAAPRMMDLGMFEAARLLDDQDPRLTERVLAGYGGGSVTDHRPWVARGLATRLLDPFRAADPRWRDGISRRLDLLEALL